MAFFMVYFGYAVRSEKYVGWLRGTGFAKRSEYASFFEGKNYVLCSTSQKRRTSVSASTFFSKLEAID